MQRDKPGPREPQTLEAWEDWVDRLIRDAMERGEFDNLPGHGKPLHIDESPHAGGLEVGFGLLKNAGVAPYWIELDKEIRAAREEIAALEGRIAAARRAPASPPEGIAPPKRKWWEPRPHGPAKSGDPVQSRELQRLRLRAEYIALTEELDRRIARFNAAIPRDLWQLERPRQAADDAGATFDHLWEHGTETSDEQ